MHSGAISRPCAATREPVTGGDRWGKLSRAGFLRRHLWKAVLIVGLRSIVLYYQLSTNLGADLVYSAIGMGATGSILLGIRLHQVARPAGWYLIATANACFVGGDLVLDVYDVVLRTPPPYPSIADAIYLSGYPLLFAGVLASSRAPGRSWSGWIDATAVCVGTLGLVWHYLMGPTVTAPIGGAGDTDTLGKLITMAYPVMDLGVLWVLAGAVLCGGAHRAAGRLMVGSVACMLVADFDYDLQLLHGSYGQHSAGDAAFLLAYVLVAAAGLHPSVGAGAVARDPSRGQGVASVVLVAGAALISPVIMLVSGLTGMPIDLPILATTSVVVFGLVLLRVWRLLGQVRNQNALLAQGSQSLRSALATQQSLQDDLRHQSLHDDLTGLANRSLLQGSLTQALGTPGPVALCLCDLDDFKTVNESLGHHLGDELLMIVAKRLTTIVYGGATVARLGGDEFAVLLDSADQPQSAIALGERIVSVLRQPVHLPDHDLQITASVGIAVAAAGATTATLLSEADAAMYEAKSAGKNRVALFETSMRSRLLERTTIVNCFAGGLQRTEFVLEYQPQFALPDGRLEGFECLVRWRHPTLGLIGPNRFIPLAEETRFILPLGQWILTGACTTAAGWPGSGGPLSVAVNVSGWQVQDPGFFDSVREALRRSGLPPSRLVLEITENVLMDDPVGIAEVLANVRRLGVLVAIDDFGTGFSSLSHLRQLPVDILKIDKSFIDPLLDPRSEGDAFVATIVRLADDLGLATVAEGIEHRSQLEALVRLGCHSGQGYLVAPSLSAAAAQRFIELGSASAGIPVGGSLLPQA